MGILQARTADPRRLAASTKAQASNLAGLFVGIVIAVIMGIAVAVPVIDDVTASANLSGTTETIANLLPLFIVLVILVAIAAPLMRRV